MKKLFLFLSVAALAAGCTQTNEHIIVPEPQADGLRFVGSIDQDSTTKVTTTNGVSTWNTNDQIAIFSVANGATAGESVSKNILYKAASDGATTDFIAVEPAKVVTASDKYYAVYPGYATYTSAITASETTPALAKDTHITDYRHAYVASNGTQAFEVDMATGLSVSNNPITLRGVGTAPDNAGEPVQLNFTPVLPILEFGFTGGVTLKQVTLQYVGETTYNQATNNFITGKGLVDLSTGIFTSTNVTGGKKGTITFRTDITDNTTATSIELNETTPVRVKFVTGYMVATGGLELSFTCVDANGTEYTSTKTIWKTKTEDEVSLYDATQKKCKHIYQPVGVPTIKAGTVTGDFTAAGDTKTVSVSASTTDWTFDSANSASWISASPASGTAATTTSVTLTAAPSGETTARTGYAVFTNAEGAKAFVAVSQAAYVPQAADYYRVNIASLNWDSSYVLDVKDVDGTVIAMITKEYFGATADCQGIVAYPIDGGSVDITSGKVAEVTLVKSGSAYVAPTDDIHCGTLSMTLNAEGTATTVDYTQGTSEAATDIYIKASNGTITLAAPATGTVANGIITAQTLTTDIKSHAVVKIGTQYWLTSDYQTTKYVDGTSITTIANGDAYAKGDKRLIIHNGNYLYTGYTIGFAGDSTDADYSNFAPTGWKVPSATDFATILTEFVGKTYAKLEQTGYAPIKPTYKVSLSSGLAKAGSVAYPNTWTSTKGSTAANGTMCGLKDATSSQVINSNTQALTTAFTVRLVKE